jgi:lysophospholipase L1-like esterase
MALVLGFGDSIIQGSVDLDGGWTQRLRRRLDTQFTSRWARSASRPTPCSTWASPVTPPRGCWPAWSVDGATGYGNDRIGAFNAAVRRVAESAGVVLVDCFDELLAGDHTALLHDGLHPNGDGHQLLADRVGEAVTRWL